MSSTRFPKLVAFDLDYTLWDLWVDTHVDGPLHRKAQRINEVLDRNNQPISFYRDVADIFHKIRAYRFEDAEGAEDRVVIAACSRTHAPDLARQCLNLLLVPSPHNLEAETAQPTTAITFFDELEIYPGSKLTHFKRLHKRTGIAYEDMLFFDDERRNGEVEKLGVTFIHVPTGLNHKVFEDGLARWRKRSSPQTRGRAVVLFGDRHCSSLLSKSLKHKAHLEQLFAGAKRPSTKATCRRDRKSHTTSLIHTQPMAPQTHTMGHSTRPMSSMCNNQFPLGQWVVWTKNVCVMGVAAPFHHPAYELEIVFVTDSLPRRSTTRHIWIVVTLLSLAPLRTPTWNDIMRNPEQAYGAPQGEKPPPPYGPGSGGPPPAPQATLAAPQPRAKYYSSGPLPAHNAGYYGPPPPQPDVVYVQQPVPVKPPMDGGGGCCGTCCGCITGCLIGMFCWPCAIIL